MENLRNCLRKCREREPSPHPPVSVHFADNLVSADVRARALYDYEPIDKGDLGFARGDILVITNRIVPGAEGWWSAKNLRTGCSGVVPSNYMIPDEPNGGGDNFKNEPWWFDIDRRSAAKQLILPGNPRGTFLVRQSKEQNMLTLSLKNFDDSSDEIDIKHYHIQADLGQSAYYITRSRTFPTLQELIAHYTENLDGLCCQLSQPCPKEPETIPFKNLEIQRSDIQLIKKLGAGKFGEVWKGKYKRKIDVAVKKMLPGKMAPEKFLGEAKTMHSVHHRRLLQLMGVVSADDPILIVMELVENGCLLNYLQEDKGRNIMFKDILDIAAQIAEGMEHLEKKKCIHRDLRTANILVGKNNSIKVADFGLAKVLFGDEYLLNEDSKFPVRWTALETVLERTFSIKSDVWSYGIVLYELVTYGRTPYAGMTSHEMMEKLQTGFRLPNPENKNYAYIECPEKMYEIMLQCWAFTPIERPTFERLRQFFDDYYTETERPYVPYEDDFNED